MHSSTIAGQNCYHLNRAEQAYVEELVRTAPPISTETRHRLAVILSRGEVL